jgi:hypothetical protein
MFPSLLTLGVADRTVEALNRKQHWARELSADAP